MDRAEQVLEEVAASREYRHAALDHLVRIYESQGDWAKALKVFHALPAGVQAERRQVAAHYLCELAEHALLQGDPERARTLLRQARTHQEALPRADILTARLAEGEGDKDGALLLYLQALEAAPGLALEIIPPVLRIAGATGGTDVLSELGKRLRQSGRVSPRQLAWLLATAVPAGEVARLPGIAAELGPGVESVADATSLSTLLARIGDAGGRYQCEDCGLNSVGWYWHCPKCRAWDTLRPAVFKWAERVDQSARPSQAS
jgi:lipopolysaccharide biosynthesis regulator YciM